MAHQVIESIMHGTRQKNICHYSYVKLTRGQHYRDGLKQDEIWNVHELPYHKQGLLLQNTIKYSDNVVCLYHLCQINNWHNILVRFVIFLRMQRYILKCAILSTYGQLNNNHKHFRSKLGSNSFIWYITTINKILFEACGWWILWWMSNCVPRRLALTPF